jgi:hypothetical protein
MSETLIDAAHEAAAITRKKIDSNGQAMAGRELPESTVAAALAAKKRTYEAALGP